MKHPVFSIFLLLMFAGNVFAHYTLWTGKQEFLTKFPALSGPAFAFFRFLPLLNIVALAGLWFFKPWAVWMAIACGMLVIGFDIYFKISYHLPVAILSFLLLLLFLMMYRNHFK